MDDINPLDRKRAEEAFRRVFGSATYSTIDSESLEIAAMLGRTGWEPEDPDLIAAREIVVDNRFTTTALQLALIAIKRGRELERGGR